MLIKKKNKRKVITLDLFTKLAFLFIKKNRASNTSIFHYFSILCTCNFLNDPLKITFSILFISFLLFFKKIMELFSFYPDDPTIAARISACLIDISCWMKDHHLQLNLAKTELLVVPSNPSFHHNFTIQKQPETLEL